MHYVFYIYIHIYIFVNSKVLYYMYHQVIFKYLTTLQHGHQLIRENIPIGPWARPAEVSSRMMQQAAIDLGGY